MTIYTALLTGEDGMEFTIEVQASDRNLARSKLMDMYPESRIERLESPEDRAERELEIYASVMEDDYDYEDDF